MPANKRWLDVLEGEHDNLRAALARAFERDQLELGLRFACALRHFWYIRGHFEEGMRWLEAALLKVERMPRSSNPADHRAQRGSVGWPWAEATLTVPPGG